MRSALGFALMVLVLSGCASGPTPTPAPAPMATSSSSDYESMDRYPAETGTSVIRLDSHGKKTAELAKCGGRAEIVPMEGGGGRDWTLRIYQSSCGNLNLYDRTGTRRNSIKLEGTGNNNRYATIDLINASGIVNVFKIEVESNSGRSKDVFYVTLRPAVVALQSGVPMELVDCGGSVTAKKSANGDVHLNFKNVERCQLFDIIGDEGGSVNYPAKYFRGQRSPSYTLPKMVMEDWGPRRVLIQVRSLDNLIEDKFYVTFFNWM